MGVELGQVPIGLVQFEAHLVEEPASVPIAVDVTPVGHEDAERRFEVVGLEAGDTRRAPHVPQVHPVATQDAVTVARVAGVAHETHGDRLEVL